MTNNQVRLIPREAETYFPTARFLSDEEQTRYEDSIKDYSGKARENLDVRSNLWKILQLNQIGIQTATLPELDLAIENGMNLKGHYEDGREVILRSRRDSYESNDHLAKDLADRLDITNFENSWIINGLGIRQDDDSSYGLAFVTDNAEVIEAPDFNHENNGKRFSRVNPDYSIDFDEQGARAVYTRKNGLSWLDVDVDLCVCSGDVHLACSDSNGRVVVINPEGTQNFSEYISRLEKETARQKAEIEERFNEAMAVSENK
ncbi:hypothetical protein CMI42_01220 [Candidatus Pacearchaeota archaeon]|nr:hypothetical protein [Candidatus Pacearchaeota archaeon]